MKFWNKNGSFFEGMVYNAHENFFGRKIDASGTSFIGNFDGGFLQGLGAKITETGEIESIGYYDQSVHYDHLKAEVDFIKYLRNSRY